MRLNAATEDTTIILARFHHDRKIGKLRRTVINIEAVEVIFKNQSGSFAGIITVAFVNLHQHVKHINENMTRTHAGVDDFDFLWLECSIFLADFYKLCLYVGFLIGFIKIVFPFCFQFVAWVSLQPQTTKTVFDHVTNNPIRRKNLCGSRNLIFIYFLCAWPRKNNLLWLSVVILIQPSNDLHGIFPVIFRNHGDHLLNDAALAQKIFRKQKLSIVCNPGKHTGQNGRERIALRNQQILIEFVGLVLIFQLIDLLHVQPVQFKVDGFCKNLRFESVLLIGEHANMSW